MKTGCFRGDTSFLHLKSLIAEGPIQVFVAVLLCHCSVQASLWQPIGPSGGDFLGSVSNPADASQLITITTGPVYSNVYKSNDGGAIWNRLNRISASDAQDMCTYDFNTLFVITHDGCFRSADAGENWNYAPFNQPYAEVFAVCVDPENPQNVYAVGRKYNTDDDSYSFIFLKSTDTGQTWNPASFFKFEDFYPFCIAVAKTNPNIIYVGGYKQDEGYYSGSLFKSTDAGLSWTDIITSVDPYNKPFVYSIAIDPTDQNRLYLAAGYVYRTTDAGESWTSGSYISAYEIGIDPVDTSNIYVSAYDNMFVSNDYAQSFTPCYDCIKGYARNIEVAPADNSTVYLSSFFGFFKSADFGQTWFTSHEGVSATVIPAFAVAKSQPQTLVIEDYGVSIMLSRDSGQNWLLAGYFGDCGNIADIVINPQDPNLVIALEGDG